MRIAVILFLFGFCFSAQSQFQIGYENSTSADPMPIIGRYLDGIADSRTIFVYRNSDEENLEEFKKVLTSCWTMNELVFMPYDEFVSYKVEEGECYFTISSSLNVIHGSGGSVSYLSDFALTFWRYVNEKAIFFSYTQLYVPLEANIMVMDKGIEGSNVLGKIYTELDVRNWNLGFLKATLTDICQSVVESGKRSYSEYIHTAGLRDLKTETLYVSEDVLIELHKLRRSETISDRDGLLKGYAYPVKLVSNKEIDQKVIGGDKNYCLTFVRNSLHKFIVVYETSTGQIVYAKMDSGFNFSRGDLQDLQKAIGRE